MEEPGPAHWCGATPGQVTLGAVRKQAEQAFTLFVASAPVPTSSFLLLVPAQTSLHDRVWSELELQDEISPSYPKLFVAAVLYLGNRNPKKEGGGEELIQVVSMCTFAYT